MTTEGQVEEWIDSLLDYLGCEPLDMGKKAVLGLNILTLAEYCRKIDETKALTADEVVYFKTYYDRIYAQFSEIFEQRLHIEEVEYAANRLKYNPMAYEIIWKALHQLGKSNASIQNLKGMFEDFEGIDACIEIGKSQLSIVTTQSPEEYYNCPPIYAELELLEALELAERSEILELPCDSLQKAPGEGEGQRENEDPDTTKLARGINRFTDEMSKQLKEYQLENPKASYSYLAQLMNSRFHCTLDGKSCWQHLKRVHDNTSLKGPWSIKEDAKLLELYQEYKNDYREIASIMGNRNKEQVRCRIMTLERYYHIRKQ